MTKIKVEPIKPPHTAVDVGSQAPFDHKPTTCWYIMGILSTIFCCLPCGAVGLVHAMIAQHEGERGNFSGHRRRLYQAKCWISWSIAVMSLLIMASLVYWGVRLGWFERVYSWCGVGAYGYDYLYEDRMNETGYYYDEYK